MPSVSIASTPGFDTIKLTLQLILGHLHMIHKLHYKMFNAKTPYAYAASTALMCNIGGLLAISFDLIWLIFDMIHSFRTYHILVLIGLSIAEAICIYSLLYLYKGVECYFRTRKNKRVKKGKAKKPDQVLSPAFRSETGYSLPSKSLLSNKIANLEYVPVNQGKDIK